MERLTKRENGHAHYPRCFEEPCGGMGCRTEDCEFKVEICERLADYEDTQLTAEEIDMDHEAAETLRQLCQNCDLDRLEKLAEADRDGRLVVLPFTSGRTLLSKENINSPRLMKDVELAIRYCSSCGIVFHMGYNVFCDLVKHGRITAVSEETEKALGAMK